MREAMQSGSDAIERIHRALIAGGEAPGCRELESRCGFASGPESGAKPLPGVSIPRPGAFGDVEDDTGSRAPKLAPEVRIM